MSPWICQIFLLFKWCIDFHHPQIRKRPKHSVDNEVIYQTPKFISHIYIYIYHKSPRKKLQTKCSLKSLLFLTNVESLKLRLPLTQWIPWSKGWYWTERNKNHHLFKRQRRMIVCWNLLIHSLIQIFPCEKHILTLSWGATSASIRLETVLGHRAIVV